MVDYTFPSKTVDYKLSKNKNKYNQKKKRIHRFNYVTHTIRVWFIGASYMYVDIHVCSKHIV